MAGINILAKNEMEINWSRFLSEYSGLKLTNIEVFPIPKELGFKEDCVGVCVHDGYKDKSKVLSELKVIVQFLSKKQFKMVELYDGVDINSDNVISICDKLLG